MKTQIVLAMIAMIFATSTPALADGPEPGRPEVQSQMKSEPFDVLAALEILQQGLGFKEAIAQMDSASLPFENGNAFLETNPTTGQSRLVVVFFYQGTDEVYGELEAPVVQLCGHELIVQGIVHFDRLQ